jgi:phosphoadenosine phosphosulfate reductase
MTIHGNSKLEYDISVTTNHLKSLRSIKDKISIGFSGGNDSAVLVDLSIKILGKDININFCHTTVQFKETYNYIKMMVEYWDLRDFNIIHSNHSFKDVIKEIGLFGICKNKLICCKYLKNKPLSDYMHERNRTIAVNGSRRAEGGTNSCKTDHITYSKYYDLKYFAPMVYWSNESVDEYFDEFDLPLNPLYKMGYRRTGCAPCPCPNKWYDYYSLLKKNHPRWYYAVKKWNEKYTRNKYNTEFRNLYYHYWDR